MTLEPVIPLEAPGGVTLQFRRPMFFYYEVTNIARDPAGNTYAVLYAVSDTPRRFDAGHGRLHLQFFDRHGNFLRHTPTEFSPPVDPQLAVLPSDPFVYREGLVAFFGLNPVHNSFIMLSAESGALIWSHEAFTREVWAGDGEHIVVSDGGLGDENGIEFTFTIYHMDVWRDVMTVAMTDFNYRFNPAGRERIFEFNGPVHVLRAGNDKILYALDFYAQTYTIERRYAPELLRGLIAVSPDGRLRAYNADLGGLGYITADVVVQDTRTGAVAFLTDRYPANGTFGHNNLLLLNYWDRLLFYDTRTAALSRFTLPFAHEFEETQYTTVGVAFDAEAGLYLIAYREHTEWPPANWRDRMPVYLDVYTTAGVRVTGGDTGLAMEPWGNAGYAPLTLEPDGTGQVRLSTNYETIGVFRYRG
jgi:hypothetical protein